MNYSDHYSRNYIVGKVVNYRNNILSDEEGNRYSLEGAYLPHHDLKCVLSDNIIYVIDLLIDLPFEKRHYLMKKMRRKLNSKRVKLVTYNYPSRKEDEIFIHKDDSSHNFIEHKRMLKMSVLIVSLLTKKDKFIGYKCLTKDGKFIKVPFQKGGNNYGIKGGKCEYQTTSSKNIGSKIEIKYSKKIAGYPQNISINCN